MVFPIFGKKPGSFLRLQGAFRGYGTGLIINAKDATVQQNFTIAHGLGHYALEHHKDPRFEKNYSVILRDACFVGQTPVELEVNLFADNLLVPSMFLQKYLNKYPYATDQELSNIFGVPSEVIYRRRLYV